MEGSGNLVGELIQGMELAKQLRQNLSSKASPETREFLIQRILTSYEKALLLLKCNNGSNSITIGQQPNVLAAPPPESPISVNESPRSYDNDFPIYGSNSKKRKALPRWSEQVRVSSENGLEGPQDDGFSWRKYGQKDILGAKFPRSYYRCTFRNTQSCWATKQVQRSDEDPFLFDITYRGNHTCSQAGNSVNPPTSPQNRDKKPNNTLVQDHHFETFTADFPSKLRVITEGLQESEAGTCSFSFPSTQYACLKIERGFNSHTSLVNETLFGSSSQPFMSPATPETSYYSVSPFQINNSAGFHHTFHPSDSDLTEIISANTSAANSPILDLDFSLDQVEIHPNFPFHTPGFLS